MKYKIHEYEITMTAKDEPEKLESFLNSLKGEIVAIIPNVDSSAGGWSGGIDFLFIIEKQIEKKE